jgi:hypothetical protein
MADPHDGRPGQQAEKRNVSVPQKQDINHDPFFSLLNFIIVFQKARMPTLRGLEIRAAGP